ncbi:MAG: phage baseplate assembly protein V [Caulobacter sp.]|nr:phage baseplate assembly protein V [Caulobacter sp.]
MAPRSASADAVNMMIGRGGVRLVNDEGEVQLLQLEVLADEVLDDVERHQDYGFNSHPLDGASAVILALSGIRGRSLAVAVGDRRYRLQLEPGEVAISDDLGQKVHLTRDGIVVQTTGKITLQADEEVILQTPKLTATVTADATIDATGDVLVKSSSKATVEAPQVIVASDDIRLGGAGANKKVALVGDAVAGGFITGPGSTKVKAL